MDPKRVFINCPFDDKFKPIFDALIFAVHDVGFVARHALINDSIAIRLLRISDEIQNAKYSIHDISRVETDNALGLPRFNMPFEAGIAYLWHALSPASNQHHFLILDSEPYRYHASLSDVAGLDAKIHDAEQSKAIAAVRNFLVAKSGLNPSEFQGGGVIFERFLLFDSLLSSIAKNRKLSTSELSSWDYVKDLQSIMDSWIAENPP